MSGMVSASQLRELKPGQFLLINGLLAILSHKQHSIYRCCIAYKLDRFYGLPIQSVANVKAVEDVKIKYTLLGHAHFGMLRNGAIVGINRMKISEDEVVGFDTGNIYCYDPEKMAVYYEAVATVGA